MHVFLLVVGTRGDLELFLALGAELRRRGHDVTLAASPFFAARVASEGVAFLPVGAGTQAELVAILRSLAPLPDDRARAQAYVERWVRPQVGASLAEIKAALARTDYVIDNLKNVWMQRGRILPGAAVTYEPPGSLDNLAKHAPRLARHGGALIELVALSRALVDPESRWGPAFRFTGFWQAPRTAPWTPPPDLVGFLDGGPRPAVVTMGSMVMFDERRLVECLAAALRRTGGRAVLVGGWSGFGRGAAVSPSVHCVDEAPYEWLFARASCVVHHGGCGTVAAALRAARPSILVPQISSQRHFAAILEREGLAAATLDATAPSDGALAAALDAAANDRELGERARRWQAVVRAEPGIPDAADAIEAHARGLGAGSAAARAEAP
jgi:UDP:flavonoid glycosyltransferase YjiC (YdhE family)